MRPHWSESERGDPLSPRGSAPAPESAHPPLAPGIESPTDDSMDALLRELVEAGGSDLHLTVGLPPRLRLDGELVNSRLSPRALRPDETLALAWSLLSDRQRAVFEAANELDFSFGIAGLARFRASIYRQRGAVGMAIRQIPYEIRRFDSLGLPDHVADFAKRPLTSMPTPPRLRAFSSAGFLIRRLWIVFARSWTPSSKQRSYTSC